MMLDYEWGNPAAAAAAMLLFGEETGHNQVGESHHQQQHHQAPMFDHYGHGLGMDFFQQPQPISAAAALFSTSTTASTTTCHHRYGLALPPAPARIGLNLGVRTYFSSGSPEEEMMVGRVCRRRTRMARCQAEGCGADLTHAKHYHRRHKVCEFHSKASIVITAGFSQRFCQQCSRFHVLSEFDQGKRSCRKRLADHNRRRRKSQDLTTTSAVINNSQNNSSNITHGKTSTTNTNNNSMMNKNLARGEKALISISKPETCSSVTNVSSLPEPILTSIPAPPMALGLGCGPVPAPTGLSASSSTGTSPPTAQSVSFLSQLGEFRGHGWDVTEDGSSFRGIYQK